MVGREMITQGLHEGDLLVLDELGTLWEWGLRKGCAALSIPHCSPASASGSPGCLHRVEAAASHSSHHFSNILPPKPEPLCDT